MSDNLKNPICVPQDRVTDEMIDTFIKAIQDAKLWERGGDREIVKVGLTAALCTEAGTKASQANDTLPPSPHVELPQDVINLVIAAREFWEVAMDDSDESAALDAALEAFASRVPYYENESATTEDKHDE